MMSDQMPRHWYEDYDDGRPGYPDQIFNLIDLAPWATVLELAAGTGAFTRDLAPRVEHVIAIDPDAGMRRILAATCPSAEVLGGAADRIPVADDAVDAVFVAQAFHWFDNEIALKEIARVLRSGGALVVMWNIANGSAVPSITAVEELLAPIWPDDFGFPLDMMDGGWQPSAWDLPYAKATFDEVREVRLANPQTINSLGLIAFFGSMGWVANLPDRERLGLRDAISAQLTEREYMLPWQTRVQWTRLTDTTPEGKSNSR